MRYRILKPSFFVDEELGDLNPLARLLFAGLWTIADREGRLKDRPRRIKAQVLPYDDCDVDDLLNQLANRGFIVRYVVGGGHYIAIPSWHKHQRPHPREAESIIPPPPAGNQGTTKAIPEQNQGNAEAQLRHALGNALGLPNRVRTENGERRTENLVPKNICAQEEQKSEQLVDESSLNADTEPADFVTFWQAYPRRERKREALTRWKRMSKRDREAALKAVQHYADYAARQPDAPLMHPSTFLSATKRTWEDWIDGVPPGRLRTGNPRGSPLAAAIAYARRGGSDEAEHD